MPIRPKPLASTVTSFDDVSMTSTPNGGGGINTTTSWDGMHFNWDAFFYKFMLKFEKDDAEARRLQKEIRDLMHKVAIEGIKAKIEVEKMNQAFERMEAGFKLGSDIASAFKEIKNAKTEERAQKINGKDPGKPSEKPDKDRPLEEQQRGSLDDQIAKLTAGFQQDFTQPAVGQAAQPSRQTRSSAPTGAGTSAMPVLYLSKSQRAAFSQNDPDGFKAYQKLMDDRRVDAGMSGELALIGAARDRAKDPAKQAELSQEYDAKSAELNTETWKLKSTRTGRSVANLHQTTLQHAELKALASAANGDDSRSVGGLVNILGHIGVNNDRLLLNSEIPKSEVDAIVNNREDELRGSLYRLAHALGTDKKGSLNLSKALKNAGVSEDDVAAVTQAGQAAKAAEVGVREQAVRDGKKANDADVQAQAARAAEDEFKKAIERNPPNQLLAAMRVGYDNQAQRTQVIANGGKPDPRPQATSPTAKIGQAIGATAFGDAVTKDELDNNHADDHLKKTAQEKKEKDIADTTVSAIAGVTENLKRDLEKAEAEAVQAAQRGAGEMDARIRQNYQQAQGMFNQMTHVLGMGRRGRH